MADAAQHGARRLIIRTLQAWPGITRSMLGVHVRPAQPDWVDTLEDLERRGVVIRDSRVIGSRAAVVYRVSDEVPSTIGDADFDLDAWIEENTTATVS